MAECKMCGARCNEGYDTCFKCARKDEGNASVLKEILEEIKKLNRTLELHKLNVAVIRAEVCKDEKLKAKLQSNNEVN